MNKKILGIGNAIVDVLAKVDDEFLIKRNFIKGSMKLINKSEFEDLKKNIKIEKVVAGGSVANTMSGIAYLKGSPSFIGKINSDSFGEMYKKSLKDINVDFTYVQKKRKFIYRRINHFNYAGLRKNNVYLSWNIFTSFRERYRRKEHCK